MPIFEFKCTKCEEFFEVIVMGSGKDENMSCPKCKSEEFERVVSKTNFNMGSGSSSGQSQKVEIQERTCSGGSCKTYTVPGDTK